MRGKIVSQMFIFLLTIIVAASFCNAKEISSKITKVTVFSDRALVTREAKTQLSVGVNEIVFNDLPGATMLNTIQMYTSQGRVKNFEVLPIEYDQITIEQVENWSQSLQRLETEVRTLNAEMSVLDLENIFLRSLETPKNPLDEKNRQGRTLPFQPVETMKIVWNFLEKRYLENLSQIDKYNQEKRKLAESVSRIEKEISAHNLTAASQRLVQIKALIENDVVDDARIELNYFVPGAFWHPVYRVQYSTNQQKIQFSIAANVVQTTGENWQECRLEFSTAIPGQGIDLPELLTWTLGEKRQFIPQPYTRYQVTPAVYKQTKQSGLSSNKQLENSMNELSQLLGQVGRLWYAPQMMDYKPMDKGERDTRSRSEDERYALSSDSEVTKVEEIHREDRSIPSPVMVSEEPITFADEGTVAASVAPSGSSKKYTPTAPPVELGMMDRGYQSPKFSDPTLPAVTSGGLDFVYLSQLMHTVNSSNKAARIPLSSQKYGADLLYHATPALSDTAFVTAKIKNTMSQPILLGQASVYVDRDFTVDAQLATCGPSEMIELPLGADQNIRLKRRVVTTNEKSGIISKSEITTYKVTIEVANYKERSIKITLSDQIPKSRNEDIEIKWLGSSEVLKSEADANGIIEWQLELAPKQQKAVTFSYSIERPVNWQLTQE